MKIIIKDYCIRCGLCKDLYPELFTYNHKTDEIDVKYDEIPQELLLRTRRAMADCAVTAIFLNSNDDKKDPIRLGLSEEEKTKSYAKYYDLEMTPVPPEKMAVLARGPIDPGKALKIQDRNDLFKPGYLDCEVGYCTMEDGTGFLANLTFMPGVTAEMFDWWFAWHSLEDLRYKIWDPEDHFYARTQNREKVLDSSLPLRERTWGTKHFVLEDIGPGPDDLILEFEAPDTLGYDKSKVGSKYCATMMCANGHGPVPGHGAVAVMTHMIREVEGGVELRSRFWIGYQIINGQAVKVIPDIVKIPVEVSMGLFAHNLKEFTHLAAILPNLYAEEKDNF